MPISLPTGDALKNAFPLSNPLIAYRIQTAEPQRTKYQARSELYGAWSVADDAKKKANQLSDAAVKEFEKTSGAAQAKVGKIELYSPKYYATCTLGGLMACVKHSRNQITKIVAKIYQSGRYSHCCDSA
jgi:solute carrier family 25 phosphate transporter 3